MKAYKGYTARVVFDESANVLHGRIEGINDVVNFQAESVNELDAAFAEAVDDYLDYCKERGEAPDRPYSGKFVVRVDPNLHRRIAEAAARANQSLNRWVVATLDAALAPSSPTVPRALRSKLVRRKNAANLAKRQPQTKPNRKRSRSRHHTQELPGCVTE